MKFDNWVDLNYLELSHNYNSRNTEDSFQHFCEFIFVGMKKGVWLPKQYTQNIKENRK